MASWVDDVVPAPGRLLAELYRKLGPGTNGLMKGTAVVGDRSVDCASVAMPVLSVSAEKDTIAPACRRRCDSLARAACRDIAAAGWACRYRRRPRRGEAVEAHRGVPGLGGGSRVERDFIHWRGHRICVSELGEGRPLFLVPGIGCSADMWQPFMQHFPESATHQFRLAGCGTLEHAAVSRARCGALRRWRRPCSTTAGSSAPTSSASRTAAPSRSSSRTTIPSASAGSSWPRRIAGWARSGARRRRWP